MKEPRKMLLAAGALALALAVGYPLFKHYQLKAAVEAYRRQLRAQGEKLTIAELTPPPPTNGPNGAFVLWSAAGQLGLLPDPPAMTLVAPGRARVAWAQAVLPTRAATNLWPQLAAAIETNRPVLAQLRQALENPVVQFDLNYSLGPALRLPHLGPLERAARWLAAAIALDLHEGRFTLAWENLRAGTALVDHCGREPVLVSRLVRLVIAQDMLNATWEALQAPGWTEAQLAELQTAWAAPDFLDQVETSLAMDRAMEERTFARCRDSYEEYQSLGVSFLVAMRSLDWAAYCEEFLKHPQAVFQRTQAGYLAWRGLWSYEDELAQAQLCQAAVTSMRLAATNRSFTAALRGFDAQWARVRQRHPQDSDWFAQVFVARDDWIRVILLRLACVNIQRRLLVTAIALKRCQLRHGRYPDDLSALVPEFLPAMPLDPMDGRPLRYRLHADGSFLLYSVGVDGVDNGGDPTPPAPAPSKPPVIGGFDPGDAGAWYRARDAVWPQPASAAEVAAWERTEARRHPLEPP